MRPRADHDTLATRLARILLTLNAGRSVVPRELAREFGVDVRTVQRDLNDRFAGLELERANGAYRLPPGKLGRITAEDTRRIAELAGIAGASTGFGEDVLRDLVASGNDGPIKLIGPAREDVDHRRTDFQLLEQAIHEHRAVRFDYMKPAGPQAYAGAQPYKLINDRGVWYLAAVDRGLVKAFMFSRISRIGHEKDVFVPSAPIEAMLRAEDSVWLSARKERVVLRVAPAAAAYFRQRPLVARQAIEEECADGSLVVSGLIAHPDQILPTLRQWLPHVRVLSPAAIQHTLEAQLRDYLRSVDTDRATHPEIPA